MPATVPAEADDGTLYRYVSWHAMQRAKERYGIEPTIWDWRDAFLLITDRLLGDHKADAVFFGHASGGRENWLVRVAGVQMLLLYNPENAVIISVLPRKARTVERL